MASKRNPGKGKRMSMYFSPYDRFDGQGGGGESEWCQGAFSVMISKAPNDNPDGGIAIDVERFRFYGMP